MSQNTDSRMRRFIKRTILPAGICLVILLSGCHNSQVQGEYDNPYSKADVKLMMTYHGASVARFDGRQWWFLAGDRWIKIESGGAYEYVQLCAKESTKL
ncbi:MAG TPA: hypothetical protein EYP57_01125 [Thermodesulfobacteriaceae bacterium]|nr:hypothetical protein [Thermodesulfobacteriaceae bacterium]